MQQALEVDAAVIGTGQAAASLAIALARRGVLQDALPIAPTVGEFLPFVLGKLRPLQ